MSRPLVVKADAEGDAVAGLTEFFADRDESYAVGVQVHSQTPPNRPPVLVTVVRAGGVGTYLLDNPRLAISCWHTGVTDCVDLTALTVAGLYSLRGFRAFRGMRETGGPVWAPDTDGTPRYLLTVEFTSKGTTP
jgi:hypothetical protein